jgi:hypothetical protein
MQEDEPKSEVARLMRQINAEYEAARLGLQGAAVTASHEFITRRMEHVAEYVKELVNIVGDDELKKLLLVQQEGQA